MDFCEVEAVWGGAVGAFSEGKCGALVEEGGEVVEADFSLGGMDGGAGEEADHFVEESVAVEGDAVAVVVGGEGGGVDGAGVVGIGRFVSTVSGKGVEVVGAGEELEGLMEGVGVEEAGEVPGEAGFEWGEDGFGVEVVGVGFGGGVEAAVEVGGDFGGVDDSDGGGEFGVECGDPVEGVHADFRRGVEVGGLAVGVDAGVGAARAVELEGLFGGFGEGGVEVVLDGVAAGLGLPAFVGAAVVGDGEF